ncbi:MAG: hypothetical protein ACYSUC_01980 [Planctomycetota bacterium]|jgi:hypothetical protein
MWRYSAAGWKSGESIQKRFVKSRAERQDDADRVGERAGADLGPHYSFLKYSMAGNKESQPALRPLSSDE